MTSVLRRGILGLRSGSDIFHIERYHESPKAGSQPGDQLPDSIVASGKVTRPGRVFRDLIVSVAPPIRLEH